jgi:Cu/Ag efflux protein CusF
MKKGGVLLTAVVFGLALALGAMAEGKAATKNDKPSGIKERAVTTTAIVQAIDPAKRVVTLKGPQGNLLDLKAGEEVKNLPQVKVGDLVKVRYYESLAYQVTKPGQAGGNEATAASATAKPGEKPAGIAASQVTVTATIEAIDLKKKRVTLKGQEGRIMDVKVQNPKNLENIKVGDQVVMTYTEALAISVEPAKKK